MFWKILQYLKENTCARVCYFCKVADLNLQFYLKNQLQHRCFPVNNEKFLRTAFYIKPPVATSILPPTQLHPPQALPREELKISQKQLVAFEIFESNDHV